MKTSLLSKLTVFTIGLFTLISCGDKKPHFIIEGTISDADTTMLYLERRSLTETTIIDSTKLDKEGNFKFKEPSLEYAEFYLLKLNGQTINLAVDSIETITVKAPAKTFALDYSVEGSEASSKIKDVVIAQNKLTQSFADLKKKYDNKDISQEEYIDAFRKAIDEYKTQAKNLIFSDYNSLASYFALFQKVDGYLIFDPFDKKDIGAFQSVATVWDQYKSKSPRAAHLKSFTLSALSEIRQAANNEETIKKLAESGVVDNSTFYNISLPDIKNQDISLASLKGKVVILDFTAYQTDFSPAHNILINNVYSKYKGNLEVYQVSLDSDAHSWQNSAVNLPWICVRDNKSLNSDLIAKFNIQGLPTTFIVNKNGDIVKRLSPNDNLTAEVQKIM
jgi:glutathione peroxidase-family protein